MFIQASDCCVDDTKIQTERQYYGYECRESAPTIDPTHSVVLEKFSISRSFGMSSVRFGEFS